MEKIYAPFFIAFLLIFTHPLLSQKRVLLEKYTSAFCGSCPNGHLIAYQLKAENPNLILVFHHSAVDGMATEHSAEWREGLNVLGTPYGMVDRVGDTPFTLAVNPVQWENKVLDRLDEPEVLNIQIEGSYQVASRKLEVDVSLDFSSLPPEGEIRLNAMIVEDSVVGSGLGWDQSNYFNEVDGHPLEGLGQPIYDYKHNNVLRAILDGTWGTPNVFPEEIDLDAVYHHQYTYIIPEAFNEQNIRLVISASMHDEEDLLNRQVLNANEFSLFGPEIVTAVNELAQDLAKKIEVFPNPANEQLWLKTDRPNIPIVELLDQTGRSLANYPDFDTSQALNTSGLNAGIYFIRLKLEEGVAVKKVMID